MRIGRLFDKEGKGATDFLGGDFGGLDKWFSENLSPWSPLETWIFAKIEVVSRNGGAILSGIIGNSGK